MSATGRVLSFILLVFVSFSRLPSDAQAGRFDTDAELAGAGARPLAMGTSFIGLADDATAVEFNPAGLLILERPELAIQMRYTVREHKEWRLLKSQDQKFGGNQQFANCRDTYFTPSFMSVVLPFDRFSIAFSELTIINSQMSFKETYRLNGQLGRNSWLNDVQVQQYGATFAYMITPQLYSGVTLKMAKLYLHREFEFNSERRHDTSYGANFGLLYRPSRLLSMGLVYKTRMPMTVNTAVGGNKNTIHPDIPESLGFGIAVFPNDRLRLAADVDRVEWSQFDDSVLDDFVRDDTTRYHIGGEYLLAMNPEKHRAWFLRAGYMWEESNASRAEGHTGPVQRTVGAKEDPKNHYTTGLGVAFEKFQLDFGIDLTEEQVDYIFSTVIYF